MSDVMPEAQGSESDSSENPDLGNNQGDLDFNTDPNQGTSTEGNESAPTGDNPAWNPILEIIPDEFHPQIKPHLSKQDQYIQKVQSQYAPYKPLIDNGIQMDQIQRAIQLAQVINADPRSVYEELGKRFGFSGQGHEELNSEKEGQQEEQQPETDKTGDGYDPLNDPRLKPIVEQTQALTQYWQQEEARKQEEAANAQIEKELNELRENHKKTYGSELTEDELAEVMQRSMFLADQKAQKEGTDYVDVDLNAGYQDYMTLVNRIRGTRANNSAPDVLGGNGGLPTKAQGLQANMTPAQRQEYIAERVRQLNEQNQ